MHRNNPSDQKHPTSEPPPLVETLDLVDRLAFGRRAPTDDVERLRARLVVRIALMSVPFWLLYGTVWYVTGLELGLYLALAGATGCVIWVPLLRCGVSTQVAGRGIAIAAVGTFFALALFARGFDIPLLSWNLLVPVAAVLFRGTRTALSWVLFLLISWLLLWRLDHLGYLPHPEHIHAPDMLRLLDVSNLIGAMLLLVMIVGSHAHVQARRRKEQDELREQLSRSEHLASLGTLAASIGHEINNPLAYIVHNLEYLSRSGAQLPEGDTSKDEPAKALEDALEGARRVQRITARLNAFARRRTETGPVSVEESVQIALDLAKSALQQVARVKVDVQPGLTVRASEELVQVLLNILVNAADAIGQCTQQGEIGKLSIAAYVEEEHAIIEIADNGPGVPKEDRERMFEPFYTTKDPGKGTGLGLAISRQIMEQFAGEIMATSCRPRGTIMRLRLELAAPAPASLPLVRVAKRTIARILIVDDEPAILRAMRRHLSEYQVDIVSNGREALEILEEGKYDLILCDVMMPQMTGPELYSLARDKAGSSVIGRFVFMTGGVFTQQQALALRETGCRTLPKPIGAVAVRKLLKRQRRADSSPQPNETSVSSVPDGSEGVGLG